MHYISSFDSCRIAVRQDGIDGAPAVLFSHYFGGDTSIWESQVEVLARRFRVVRFDTRGQGVSDAPEGPYSVRMLGCDALAVMDALGLDTAAFVGLSQGAMSGLWLAVHHPKRISRLVVANSTPYIPNKPVFDQYIQSARTTTDVATIVEPMILGWLTDGFKTREPAKARAAVETAARMSPTGFAGNCAVLRDVDLRADLTSIRSPTLVIAGAEDGPRGAASQMMADKIPGATLLTIAGAAHLTQLENPEAFNRALTSFLSEHDGASGQ